MRTIVLLAALLALPCLAHAQTPPAPDPYGSSLGTGHIARPLPKVILLNRLQAHAARHFCAGETQAKCLLPTEQKWRSITLQTIQGDGPDF